MGYNVILYHYLMLWQYAVYAEFFPPARQIFPFYYSGNGRESKGENGIFFRNIFDVIDEKIYSVDRQMITTFYKELFDG